MPAERAGVRVSLLSATLTKILYQYTVTMFLVDTSPSMGAVRTVDLPPGPNGEEQTAEMTNLEWALQFVKLKIQEMVSIFAPSGRYLYPITISDIQRTKDRSMWRYTLWL